MSLPPNAGPERDAAILQRITDGTFDPIQWATINSSIKDHTGEFQVFTDALKIDGVRINVSAELEQKIADILECSLLTPKLADMIWEQRQVTLTPSPQPIASSTQAMIDHSGRIDAQLEALGNPPWASSHGGETLGHRRGYARAPRTSGELWLALRGLQFRGDHGRSHGHPREGRERPVRPAHPR